MQPFYWIACDELTLIFGGNIVNDDRDGMYFHIVFQNVI